MFNGVLSRCRLCPRECGVDRASDRLGYCGAGNRPRIFRFGPHHGEEPPISGTRGSGTIFFSRCTLRCIYCQNYPWSQQGGGEDYDTDGLCGMLRQLSAQGCHNWNLVSPTPWLPWIVEAIERAKEDGIRLPVVYNTSGFEKEETLSELDGKVEIYLTDLRYADPATAANASDARNYVDIARNALKEMWRQAGPLQVDKAGIAVRGTICRVLILPGHADEAADNLRWLAGEIGPGIAVSVMSQYLPTHKAVGQMPWGRRISRAEYDMVTEALRETGLENGWTQEYRMETPDDLVGWKMEASNAIDMEKKA